MTVARSSERTAVRRRSTSPPDSAHAASPSLVSSASEYTAHAPSPADGDSPAPDPSPSSGASMTTAARSPGSASRTSGSCAGSSRITIAGSACRRMAWRMSDGVSEARGTSTAPTKWMARLHTSHSGRLSQMRATSSPRPHAELARQREREHARAAVELVVGERREDAVHAPAERRLGAVLGDPAREQPRQRRRPCRARIRCRCCCHAPSPQGPPAPRPACGHCP